MLNNERIMHVYEYDIKQKGTKETYIGSYTVIAGCENEAKLKKQFQSRLVQTFKFWRPKSSKLKKEKILK